MKSPEYVASKLKNHTHADDFSIDVDSDNRYVYTLNFSEEIGFDWFMSVIGQVSGKCNIDLQRWKIHPSEDGYNITVKEVDRREDTRCENQGNLYDYESYK